MNGASDGGSIADICGRIAAHGVVNVSVRDIDERVEPAAVPRLHRVYRQTLESLPSPT